MIVEAVLEVLASVLVWLLRPLVNLVPSPPSWALSGVSALGDISDLLYSFDEWIPVTLALTIAGFVLGVWAVSLTIGLLRVIASYLTFGGGAT